MVDTLSVIMGIILALIATFCFNLAIVFQKRGLIEGPEIKFEEGIVSVLKSFKVFFKNKSWISGFFLGIIGWIPYVIAMGLVGILVVQPIMSVGLIVFVIAANRILGERISLFEYISICMLIIAPILIVFAGISEVRINLYQFVVPFLIFLVISFSTSFICFLISKRKRGTQLESLFIMFVGAILYALGGIFTNVFAQAFIDAKINLFTYYGWIEVLFGVFWFDYIHLWVFLGFWGMIICNISSVVFYQSAFQKGKTVLMFPILNSFALIIPIVVGLFVFRQSFNNDYLFLIAIVFILSATLILSKFQAEIEIFHKIHDNSKKSNNSVK
ncbi:MAG: hypothetical protein ACFFAN_06355 [Promethearchaeota archaeon]